MSLTPAFDAGPRDDRELPIGIFLEIGREQVRVFGIADRLPERQFDRLFSAFRCRRFRRFAGTIRDRLLQTRTGESGKVAVGMAFQISRQLFGGLAVLNRVPEGKVECVGVVSG